MKIKKKAYQKQWFSFEKEDMKGEFEIRPYPFSNFKIDADNPVESLWNQFDYCLTGWKGLVDDDDKPLEFNEENKRLIFDFVHELRDFVGQKANGMVEVLNGEVKN